jgi:hypothetical protein
VCVEARPVVSRSRWVRRNRKGPVVVLANKTDGILDRSDGQVGSANPYFSSHMAV